MTPNMLILAFGVIILMQLGRGLFYLVRDKGQNDRTAKALTYRIIFSLLLFVLLLLGAFLGVLSPHAISG